MIRIHAFSSEDTIAILKNKFGKIVHVRKGQELTEEEFNSLIIKNGTVKYTIGKNPEMLETGNKPKAQVVEKVINNETSSPSAAEVLLRTKATVRKK